MVASNGIGFESSTAGAGASEATLANKENTTPPRDDDVSIVAKAAEKALPKTPVEDIRNQAPGIPDRRRSTRPQSVRTGSGSSTRSGKGGKRVGPNIAIKVEGVNSPLASPLVASPMSMTNLRSEMKLTEGDVTPGESSVGRRLLVNSGTTL